VNESSLSESVADEVVRLFRAMGHSEYGGEAVSQLEHALQAATIALQHQESVAVVIASLLHDVGHLLHDLPEDAPLEGVDDLHETLGARWLSSRFGPEVTEPVRLHVAAKRYLCTVDSEYQRTLSEPSLVSLGLQGGLMSTTESLEFEASEYFREAIVLRQFDDAAKVPGLITPPIEHFVPLIRQMARTAPESRAEVFVSG
jgi:phosphonate degradation associated HDIG domain protein